MYCNWKYIIKKKVNKLSVNKMDWLSNSPIQSNYWPELIQQNFCFGLYKEIILPRKEKVHVSAR